MNSRLTKKLSRVKCNSFGLEKSRCAVVEARKSFFFRVVFAKAINDLLINSLPQARDFLPKISREFDFEAR